MNLEINSVTHTIVFGPEDSGAGGHDVIYRAQAGKTPILSGGQKLNPDYPRTTPRGGTGKGRWIR